MTKQKKGSGGGSSMHSMNSGSQKLDFGSIMKDVEFLSSTHMTWKEKKELENKKAMSLRGKPPKSRRLPLSVARVVMKKQKEREAKKQQENSILGRFSGNHGRDVKKTDRRKPEDTVLKSTEGYFRNGVLDVKNLLQPSAPRANDDGRRVTDNKNKNKKKKTKTKKKKKGGKNRGKKNGGRMRG